MFKELIVVEGKNDAQAVRRALGDVDVIWTEGFGLTADKLSYIAAMAQRQGVIVFTDPDTVGEQIREKIRRRVPSAKHVYLTKAKASRNGDIGVENAEPEEIRRVFANVRNERDERQNQCPVDLKGNEELFRYEDLYSAGLAGQFDSQAKRSALGRILGIGEGNAKQFLHRLNRFGISREEFWDKLQLLK